MYCGVEGIKAADDFKLVLKTADDLVEAIEEMVIAHKDDMAAQKVKDWETKVDEVEDRTRNYKTEIFKKAVEVRDAAANTSNASNVSVGDRASSPSAVVDPARKAKVEVDILWKTVSEDGKALASEINKVCDWGLEEDFIVEVAMKSLETWNNKFEKLVEKGRDIEKTYCFV